MNIDNTFYSGRPNDERSEVEMAIYDKLDSLGILSQNYKACISRKTPKYRLFSYLFQTVQTAILQLRVHKNQVKCTRNAHGMHTTKRQYNDNKRSQLPR